MMLTIKGNRFTGNKKYAIAIGLLFSFVALNYGLHLMNASFIVKLATSLCTHAVNLAYDLSKEPQNRPPPITYHVIEKSLDSNKVFGSTPLNLMEDYPTVFSGDFSSVCTEEWMNEKKLPQDHPCVIDIIRRRYLYPPAAPDIPYYLLKPNVTDTSAGQAGQMLNFLKNKTGGFFIECGALDGEYLSNTLMMERFYKWQGILIEADQHSFGRLLSLRRKAFALPVCLSIEVFPTKVAFQVEYGGGSIKENSKAPIDTNGRAESIKNQALKATLSIQCFPLYSIMLAVGQTKVDFFSLDVEGHELKILRTIPWHKVDVETFTLEWNHVGRDILEAYMAEIGYYAFGENTDGFGPDLFFAKNRTLRS